MRALEIAYEGKIVAVAGMPDGIMVSAGVTRSIEDASARLSISGMCALGVDGAGTTRRAHVTWTQCEALAPGGRLTVRLVETDEATPPIEHVAADSEEHLAAMAEYRRVRHTSPPLPRSLQPLAPRASLRLAVPGSAPVEAAFESGRQFLSCHFLWDAYQPGQYRASLRSYSTQEAMARSGARTWFSGKLQVGESCRLEIGG